MARLALEDSREARRESLPALPAKARGRIPRAPGSRRSNPPRHARACGILRASCERIFRLTLFPSLFQLAKVHSRFVVEGHASSRVVSVKDASQLAQHRRVIWMPGSWRI